MVQEVTTRSWGSRIVNAFWGILIGIVLIIGAFILIFWNEGNSLYTAQSLEQTQKILITVPNAPLDPKNDMRVVYFTGTANTNNILRDKLLDISEKAIKLSRNVTMYQWKENSSTSTEKEVGGSEKETKTYSYEQIWSGEIIDSTKFKEQGHNNPNEFPIRSQDEYAKEVTVGDFHLPPDLIMQINGETAVDLANVDTTKLKDKVDKPINNNGTDLYIGENAHKPAIGDIRITVTEVLPQQVSVIAQQTGNSVQAYAAPAGKSISLITTGQQSPSAMINDAQSQNKIMTWVWRAVSLLMLIIGIGLILQPLSVIADVIPFLGNLISAGTGLAAFICGLLLWAGATAIAWFTVRPLFAVVLIAVSVGISYLALQLRKPKKVAKK